MKNLLWGPDCFRTPEWNAQSSEPIGQSLRVLLADDNAVNRKLAASILLRAGHNAILVTNGQEAVAAMTRERFDVVLMDVEMPVMGGFEATRLIRELEAGFTRTPIIAVTTRAMKATAKRASRRVWMASCPSPFIPAKLLKCSRVLPTDPGRTSTTSARARATDRALIWATRKLDETA